MNLSRIDIALLLVTAALEFILAIVLLRGKQFRVFPRFFLYTSYAAAAEISLVIAGSLGARRTYFEVYWAFQVIYVVLGLLAMDEAYRDVLKSYYRSRRGFLWQIPAVVLAVFSIVLWKWFRHSPVQAGPVTTAFIIFALASDYMRAAVFGLFVIHVMYWQMKWRQYTFTILQGFSLFSLVGMLADFLRSDFGTKMNVFFAYAPGVAYIVACVMWLAAFTFPLPPNTRTAGRVDFTAILGALKKLKGTMK